MSSSRFEIDEEPSRRNGLADARSERGSRALRRSSSLPLGGFEEHRLGKTGCRYRSRTSWANYEDLHVVVDGVETVEASSAKRAQDLVLYEHKGARIRLCKVASEQMANPGDVISFTIRFDNVGEQPLSNLVITDSLTPRLEFVPGSDKSSLKGRFTATPNSLVPKFCDGKSAKVSNQGRRRSTV